MALMSRLRTPFFEIIKARTLKSVRNQIILKNFRVNNHGLTSRLVFGTPALFMPPY